MHVYADFLRLHTCVKDRQRCKMQDAGLCLRARSHAAAPSRLTQCFACRASVNYSVTVHVCNQLAQSSPPIYICLNVEAGDYDSKIECSRANYAQGSLLGVPDARRPLEIIVPSLYTEIEQR